MAGEDGSGRFRRGGIRGGGYGNGQGASEEVPRKLEDADGIDGGGRGGGAVVEGATGVVLFPVEAEQEKVKRLYSI